MPTKNSTGPASAARSLGSAIRQARRGAELSQQQLAVRVGVSQGTVSFWERDVESPSLDNLVRLLATFPDLVEAVRLYRTGMLAELRQIERTLFEGRCACENCCCGEQVVIQEN